MLRTALTTALLLVLGTASAQGPRPIQIIERSYELDLSRVVFPLGPAGSVIVKPCAECTNVIHQVDASTSYLLNAAPVSYEDFMLMVDERRRIDGGRMTSVGVYYDVETKKVKRILLSYAAQ